MHNTEPKDISIEIKNRQDHAIELRAKGYNCSQCVLMALSDKIGLSEKQAARIGAAYGTGFAGTGGICGVISILGVAEGMLSKGYAPEDKSKVMWNTKALLDKFKESNNDRFLCRDLKGKEDAKKCPDLIKESIELFLMSHPEIFDHKESLLEEIKRVLHT